MKTRFLKVIQEEVSLATAIQNVLYFMNGKTTDQAIEARDEAIKTISKWVDKFGLLAIKCVGEDEPEKIKGLFGEMVDVPENIIRNEFKKFLREKLRKELFK